MRMFMTPSVTRRWTLVCSASYTPGRGNLHKAVSGRRRVRGVQVDVRYQAGAKSWSRVRIPRGVSISLTGRYAYQRTEYPLR